jgi:OmcA/MtrC family decaheme c-type cytochrome
MPVLIHKIHMGKNLPSVKAGTPYRIWHRGAWSDFSDVGFPSGTDELMTCAVCHQKAAQANNAMTNPTRAGCGSCHDNVNFATGANHVNLPQLSDKQCSQCHVPTTGNEFDASVKGAHTVATRSTQLAGVNFAITGVTNNKPGQKPTVAFTVRDNAGNLLDPSKFSSLNLVMAGPTTDYSGYVSESAKAATIAGGQWNYTFTTALPDKAAGTFAIGIEGYKTATVNPGTVKEASVRDLGANKVFYFGINGAKAVPRRQVVSQDKCLTCHNTLLMHGGNRQTLEYCVVCHNPGVTDVSMRASGDTPESINLKTMIHKIHTGSDLTTDFTVMGHGNSVNNYNDLGYVGDRRNCEACHLPGTYNLPLPETTISQVAPRDYLNPMPPTSGACLSCHTTKAAAAHAAVNISPTLGESCEACHGPNAEAAVSKVHARQ